MFSSNFPGLCAPPWEYFGASLDHSVLALCFAAVRHQFSFQDPTNGPELLRAPGTQGMDTLWRDAVRSTKDRKDMRPKADPLMVWDERREEGVEIIESTPLADAPSAEEPEPESFPVPQLPDNRAPAANPPRLEPMKDTFMKQGGAASTSAFLEVPKPKPGSAADDAQEWRRSKAAAQDKASKDSSYDRRWRRLDSH